MQLPEGMLPATLVTVGDLYSAVYTKHALSATTCLPPPPHTHTPAYTTTTTNIATHTYIIYVHIPTQCLSIVTVAGCAVFPMDPSTLAATHHTPLRFVIVARACGEFNCVTITQLLHKRRPFCTYTAGLW